MKRVWCLVAGHAHVAGIGRDEPASDVVFVEAYPNCVRCGRALDGETREIRRWRRRGATEVRWVNPFA